MSATKAAALATRSILGCLSVVCFHISKAGAAILSVPPVSLLSFVCLFLGFHMSALTVAEYFRDVLLLIDNIFRVDNLASKVVEFPSSVLATGIAATAVFRDALRLLLSGEASLRWVSSPHFATSQAHPLTGRLPCSSPLARCKAIGPTAYSLCASWALQSLCGPKRPRTASMATHECSRSGLRPRYGSHLSYPAGNDVNTRPPKQ